MPQRSKGARLWLKPAERGRDAVWVIKDGGRRISTGCASNDIEGAEQALAYHIATKVSREASAARDRCPTTVPIADVLMTYWQAKRDSVARPRELQSQIGRLNDNLGGMMIGDLTRADCEAYARKRKGKRAPTLELIVLKAATNLAFKERQILHPVPVWVPVQSRPRERWLTRDEVARLLWSRWRHHRDVRGVPVYDRRHLALFILIARYAGTRSGAILDATWKPEPGRGWIDVDGGVFHRAADGERETNKRKPAIRLPRPLLAHLRRWRKNNPHAQFVVEWGGRPVRSVKRAWAGARTETQLGADVTPHVLRHTAVTWAMQAGADKWEAAGFFGMSHRILEQVYGHHHPDHQSSVHIALAGGKRSAKRSAKSRLSLVNRT